MSQQQVTTRSARLRGALIGAMVAIAWAAISVAPAAADFSDYGIASSSASLSTAEAGAHPDMELAFTLKTDPSTPEVAGLKEPYARTRDLVIELPPGLIGNPNKVASCSALQFASYTTKTGEGCPIDSQVGVVALRLYGIAPLTEPIYNMVAPGEETVARLGFYAANLPNFINIGVRSGSDYGLTASVEGVPGDEKLISSRATIWGVPASSSHDLQRLTPEEAYPLLKSQSPPRSSGLEPAPFLSNPTSCGSNLAVTFKTDSYQLPGVFSESTASLPTITDCGKIGFTPAFSLSPTSRSTSAPSGLDATLTIPQNESVDGVATSQLRNATVTLPAGLAIASGAADGLQACSAAEVGYQQDAPSACPEASKVGSAEFEVPALSRTMRGSIYQRSPEPGHLFRIWLIADDLGVHVKIPGEIQVNPGNGQITSIFVDTPQVPVESLKLHFKGGPRGVLATPSACGTYSSHWEFGPWSGGTPAIGQSVFAIDENCSSKGFQPRFDAGSTNAAGGAFTHFLVDLVRQDGEANISALDLTLPPGLLAKVAGVPHCEGAAAVTGQCSAGSKLGTVSVAVGPGSNPLWIPQPGKAATSIYLSGPYKGAPYSLVIKVPAQAGPFDLGTVVTRAAISVDPTTAQVSVKSDPLPQILEGVPVSYRTIHAEVVRPEFMINPTSCDPMTVAGRAVSPAGNAASLSSPFQAGSCASLGFTPNLVTKLSGGTKRNDYPALRAELKTKRGDANIARAVVSLPHSEFLAQNHINTICTRVQFAADQCPKGSIYGHARAITPLLDQPLEGPVYLRSSSNPLPDLVVALRGQVDLDLVGRIDSANGGIRTTFNMVPDAQVTKFVLNMKGGQKGLLVNSRNLCSAPSRSIVKLDGQNGKVHDFKPLLKNGCGRNSKKG